MSPGARGPPWARPPLPTRSHSNTTITTLYTNRNADNDAFVQSATWPREITIRGHTRKLIPNKPPCSGSVCPAPASAGQAVGRTSHRWQGQSRPNALREEKRDSKTGHQGKSGNVQRSKASSRRAPLVGQRRPWANERRKQCEQTRALLSSQPYGGGGGAGGPGNRANDMRCQSPCLRAAGN